MTRQKYCFNDFDKTSIWKNNDIDIMAWLSLKHVASTVYTKSGIYTGLNLNYDKGNTQLKTDVDVFVSMLQAGIRTRVLVNAVDINGRLNTNATYGNIVKQIKK